MSIRDIKVLLRNISGSTITLGTINILPSNSVLIWDTIDYTKVLSNFLQVLDSIATFNQSIGAGTLVLSINNIDQTVDNAFAQFYELQVAYQSVPSDVFAIVRLEGDSAIGLADIVLTTGSQKISGDLDLDGYSIISVNLVDGVNVADHKSRHINGGADQLDGYQIALTYSPINYAVPNSNIIGQHISKIDKALGSIVGGSVIGPAVATDNSIVRFDTTTGKLVQNSNVQIDDTGNILMNVHSIQNIGIVDFNIAQDPASIPYQEGRVFYDQDNRTLSLYGASPNSTLQIGQEQTIWVRNDSGVTITNGVPVYITALSGNTPVIDLAGALDQHTRRCVGLATEDILTGQKGYITTFGSVHDVDTSAYQVNDILYLGITPGTLTTTPALTEIQLKIGIVTKVSATHGIILVAIDMTRVMFNDGYFQVYDNIDNTKKMNLELSLISPSSIVTLTVPNRNITLGNVLGPVSLSSTNNALVRWDGSNGQLTKNSTITVSDSGVISNIATPILATDAATKGYIDGYNFPVTAVTFANVNAALATANASISVNNQKITNLLSPTLATDAATKSYIDGYNFPVTAVTFTNVNAALATANASISVNNQKITNLLSPTLATDAVTKSYIDGYFVTNLSSVTPAAVGTSGSVGTGTTSARSDHVHALTFATANSVIGTANASISVNNQKITNLLSPTLATDAATKSYIDGYNFPVTAVTFANVNAALATANASISVNNQKITNLLTPTLATDAATKGYIDGYNFPGSAVTFANVNAALATANASISVNNQNITNLLSPTLVTDAATKGYVDTQHSLYSVKTTVDAVATGNIASLSGLSLTIDAVSINTDGMRVLVTAQSTGTQNGIWVAHSGAWTRADDMATGTNVYGAVIFSAQGLAYRNTGWILNNSVASIVGTNNLSFVFISAKASQLFTQSGDIVNLSSGAPPVSGQVLLTTSATTATWQNIYSVVMPAEVGTGGSPGAVLQASKADHVHALSFTTLNSILSTADTSIVVNSKRIITLANPIDGTDAVNKQYADAKLVQNFRASDFNDPSTEWSVTVPSSLVTDTVNAGLLVRRFDDTIQEGVGWSVYIPPGATTVTFTFHSKAMAAPAAARTVGLALKKREISNNTAVAAWSSTTLNNISIPTNVYFQKSTQTITLATLSLIADRFYQLELVRQAPSTGTNLTGDWGLFMLVVSWGLGT